MITKCKIQQHIQALYRSIFFICFSPFLLFSQSDTSAFGFISPGGGAIPVIAHHSLDDFWETENGIAFFISMPFYYGEAQIGLQYMALHGQEENLPDFSSFFYYLQWGAGLPLYRKARWFNGIRIGSTQMRFEENEVYAGLGEVSESELTMALQTRLDWEFRKSWLLYGASEYSVIYTYKRISRLAFSFGISRRFKSPKWLVELFK